MPLDPTEVSGLFVDGAWRTGAERFTVRDKYTGQPVAQFAVPDPDQVDAALAAAADEATRDLPVPERAAILRRAVVLLRERRAGVTAAYRAETGFTAADADTEFDRTLTVFELSAQEGERLAGEVVPVGSVPGQEGTLCFTQRIPVGVVAAITPFNAPLSTVAHKLAPALAAGNAVVLKPAELTPCSALHLTRALLDAGLPPRRIQLLPGPGETVGDRIVRHPAVGYVTFTGSTAVGRHIRAACGLARTQLELGSNSPTVIWSDADLDRALPLIVRAGYRKAGQVCTSVQRLLVHRAVAEEVTGRLAELVAALGYGDPREEGTAVGPLISSAAADRAEQLIRDAVTTGGKVRTGGTRDGAVLAPTVLSGLTPEARLSTVEAFAPLVAVSTVDSLDAAVARANATPYGLQAGVFCQDLDVAMAFARRLRMGGVIINDTSSYHPDLMPYGGVKDSGRGVAGPRYAVTDMTDSRTVVLRLRPPRD